MRAPRLIVCAMVVVACSDSPSAPATTGQSGSLSFAFTGARGAGTYTAAGAIPSQRGLTLGTASWATSATDDTTKSLIVLASLPHSSTTWDVATLLLPRLTAGTDSINFLTCAAGACATVIVSFGARFDQSLTSEYDCILDSGTVTLTAISTTRASGSFSGSGSCTDPASNETPFTMSNGVFDVGILSGGLPPSARLSDKP